MSFCSLCKAKASLKCQRCDTPYCSSNCQSSDWLVHRPTCFPMPRLVQLDALDKNPKEESHLEKDFALIFEGDSRGLRNQITLTLIKIDESIKCVFLRHDFRTKWFYAKLMDESDAEKALEKLSGKTFTIEGRIFVVRLLQGAQATEFLVDQITFFKKSRERQRELRKLSRNQNQYQRFGQRPLKRKAEQEDYGGPLRKRMNF